MSVSDHYDGPRYPNQWVLDQLPEAAEVKRDLPCGVVFSKEGIDGLIIERLIMKARSR